MPAQLRSVHIYYGIITLVVLAPLVFFPSLISLYRLPKITFISLFVALLLWLWLFLLVQEREQKTIFPLFIPLVLYLGISALSLFKATNLFEGVFALFQEATYIFFFWLVVNQIRTPENIKTILLCSTFSAFVVSLIGIYQMFGGDIPGLVNLSLPGSTFGNKNMAAQFILLTLPLPYLFLLSTSDRQKEILFGIAAAVVSTYLLYTGTRAAWAGAIVASLIMFLLFRLKTPERITETLKVEIGRKKNILLGIALFTIVMNFIPPYIVSGWTVAYTSSSAATRFATVADIDQDTSFLNRLAMWANTWEMFKDHPWLGVGKGNFKIVYSLYAEKKIKDPAFSSEMQPREAHNDYIQLLGETGVFGFFSFLWILLLLAFRVWGSIPGKKDPNWLSLIFALCFSIVAILVEASLDFPFELPVSEAFFWIFAGLLWVSCKNNSLSTSPVSPDRATRSWEWELGHRSGRLAVGFLSALAILIAAVHLTLLRAEFHFSRGVGLAQEERSELALQELKKAESLNPTAHRYPLFRGLVALRMKRYQEAVEANLRSLKSHPYYINAYTNLGVAYATMGKIKEAEKAWQMALEIWPDHNDARNNLATTYALHGRKEEALALLRESLRRNPADETAKKKLENLLQGSLPTSR